MILDESALRPAPIGVLLQPHEMKRSRIGAALGYNAPRGSVASVPIDAAGPAASPAVDEADDHEEDAAFAALASDPTTDLSAAVQILRSEFASVVSVKKQKLEYKQTTTHRALVVCPLPVALLTQLRSLAVGQRANTTYRRELFELQRRREIRLCKVPAGELGVISIQDLQSYCDSLLDGMEAAKRLTTTTTTTATTTSSDSNSSSFPATTATYGKSDRLAVLSFLELLHDSNEKQAVNESDVAEAIKKALSSERMRPASSASSSSSSSSSLSSSSAKPAVSTLPRPVPSAAASSSLATSTAAAGAAAVSRGQVEAVIAWLLREGFLARESAMLMPGAAAASASSSSSSASSSSSGAATAVAINTGIKAASTSTEECFYSFAVPASGALWSFIPAGRAEMAQRLKIRKHHEISVEDLMKAKLSRSPLPMKFHYRDALGCGIITQFIAATGGGGAGRGFGKQYVRLTADALVLASFSGAGTGAGASGRGGS